MVLRFFSVYGGYLILKYITLRHVGSMFYNNAVGSGYYYKQISAVDDYNFV